MMIRIARGSAWLLGGRLASRCVDLMTLFVLSRALAPADFGVVAIAMTVISIVEAIFQLPLYQVLVRMPTTPEKADFDTAFTLSFLRGLALVAVVAALSFPFAYALNDVRLTELVLVLSLAPASRGITSPRIACFARNLSFAPLFIIELGGKLSASAATVVVLVNVQNYWAIVASTVCGPIMSSVFSFILAPYGPRLSLKAWSNFSNYFRWGTASQLIGALNWQCDRLLLGFFATRTQLGNFSMAADLSAIPHQTFLAPLFEPLASLFAKLGRDTTRLSEAFNRVTDYIVIAGLPAFVGLSVVSKPLFALMLDARWLPAEPMFRWLVLETVPYLLTVPLVPLLVNFDRMRLMVNRNIIELVVKIPLVVIGGICFGIAGIIGARLAMACVINIVAAVLIEDLIGLKPIRQFTRNWRAMVSCAVMVLVTTRVEEWAAQMRWSALATLTVVVFAGAATYAFSMLCCGHRPYAICSRPGQPVSGLPSRIPA